MMLYIDVFGSATSDWIKGQIDGTFVISVDRNGVIYSIAQL